MPRFRTALLTQHSPKIKRKLLRLLLAILFFAFLLPAPNSQLQAAFNDLPTDPLYSPYIEDFQQANIIVGDTAGGKPTGNLRPFDQIIRNEFTKITTLIRLLELAQNNGGVEQYQNLDLDSFTLKINEQLTDYYSPQEGTIDFKDVADKDPSCASNPEGCEPWYGQYVNYAAAHGLLKGFPDGNFKPADPILRIHAFKLLMASNSSLPAAQDERFQRLQNDARIENVHAAKCLQGAEDLILQNNGGETLDGKNLLAYAILGDKLDFFGSQCEFFTRAGADTPEKRAALLQKPLTRQEIARYFALTTTYNFLQIDHSSDETTSTQEENGMNYFEEEEVEISEEQALADELEKNLTEEEKKTKEELKKEQEELTKENELKAGVTIRELAAMTKQGRCCVSMALDKTCKRVKFAEYKIAEASSYNYEKYEGGTWHKAEKNGSKGEVCWIPFGDILGGFEENGSVQNSETLCGLTSSQKNLISKYGDYYTRDTREIWTTSNSNKLKMFMQIGLDLAEKNSKELEVMIASKKADCNVFKDALEKLNSGHIAASLRHLPESDPKIKEAEKLLLSS